MNKKIKNCLALLLVISTLLISNAPVFASEVVSPVKNEQTQLPVKNEQTQTQTQLSASFVQTGFIWGDDVRLRRTPGGVVMALLAYGTPIQFLAGSTDGWTKVLLQNGLIGFVASQYAQGL